MFYALYRFGKKNDKVLFTGFLFLSKNFHYNAVKGVGFYASVFSKIKIR